MKEFPVLFGPGSGLLGVVTMPTEGACLPVACLMFNMGATYRVGPRRINVKLARHMAELGISSIRFDLAGLGDSGAPGGAENFQTQAVLDLQSAMDIVETLLGIRRFIVIGLCSGAVNGMAVAVADPRVVGLLMFDGYAFPSRRVLLERNLCRLAALPFNAAVREKTARWLGRHAGGQPRPIFVPDPPEVTQARFREAMLKLTEREASVFLLYTATLHVRDRGRDHLGPFAQEPFAQKIEYRFEPEMDHTLTSVASQESFLRLVGEWARRASAPRPPREPQAHGGTPGRSVIPLHPGATVPAALDP